MKKELQRETEILAELEILADFTEEVDSKLGLMKKNSLDRLRLEVGEISGRNNQMSISKEAGKSDHALLEKGK